MDSTEHLDGMSTHGEPHTTTLNSALDDDAAAMQVTSNEPMAGISEENGNVEIQLDPELGQLHDVNDRDDPFYDPSVDQTGPNYMMGGDLDHNGPAHVTQNINDMVAPTPLATVVAEHQTLAGNENDNQHQHQRNEDEDEQENKRRRVQRACDACRRKKIRCDGAQAGKRNITCSNCLEQKAECTYVEAAKRRGPPPGYIEALEWKVHKFEELLARLKPDLNLIHEVGPPINRDEFELNEFKHSLNALGIDSQLQTGRSRAAKALSATSERMSSRKGKNIPMNLPDRSTTLASGINPPSFPAHSQAEVDAVMGLLGHGAPHEQIDPRARKMFGGNVMDDTGRLVMSRPDSPTPQVDNPDDRARSHSIVDATQAASAAGGKEVGPGEESSNPNFQARIKEADAVEAQENQDFALECTQNNFPEEGFRFHGKSSGMQLLRTIADYRYAEEGGSPQEFSKAFTLNISQNRRAAYWAIPMWEAIVSETKTEPLDLSRWPEPDLAQQLIDAYFATDNLVLPLLNRLIFQANYDKGAWKTNHRFAKVCLVLFANAAKSVDDPRVYWYHGDPHNEREAYRNPELYKHSAGWRWVEAVMRTGRSWLSVVSLEDLQIFVLFANFCFRSAVLSTVWAIGGFGLKSSIDIGIHTKAGYSRTSDKREKELLKRAFWCLIYIDTYSSAALGRSLQMSTEDYDVDYPLDVDDEFWSTGDPATDFVQPANKPSRISVFVCLIKLVKIISRAMKVIYPVNRDVNSQDNGVKAQERMIAELDSSLFSWLDSVPEHLRWDAQKEDVVFFEQSCVLYSYYYFTQILIHRPFIPSPKTSPAVASLALPSLAICTNAARSCAHIADLQITRLRPNYHILLPAFTSAIVLLMNVWASKKTGRAQDSDVNLREVRKCLHALRDAEPWWRGAGRMRDILMELGSISDTSLKTPTPYKTNTPTPMRQQTFEPEPSGLRTEIHSAEGSPAKREDTFKAPVQPKPEEQPLSLLDARNSSSQTPFAAYQGPQGYTTTGSDASPAQPWFTHPWQPAGSSFLSVSTPAPSSQGDGAPLTLTTSTSQLPSQLPIAGMNYEALSPRTFQFMFSGGANAMGNAIPNPINIPGQQPALSQAYGQNQPDNQTLSSNAAMLNGMYSLLSGNIHNLQLPEYQLWLHSVSQSQQLPQLGNFPHSPLPSSNMSSMAPSANTATPGVSNASIDPTSNGQWNNFDIGLNLDAAPDVNGAMADIWSMAPNNFEMDEWSRYLSEAQPPSTGNPPADNRQR